MQGFPLFCLFCLLSASHAFIPQQNRRHHLNSGLQMSSSPSTPPSSLHKQIGVSLLSGFLLFGGLPQDNFLHALAVPSAHADIRAAQKRTYFRFIPKLITGRDFYKTDLKQAIDKNDWAVVTKFFEVFVSKYNGNDPTQADLTDTYVNKYLSRPLTIFAGSFAERGSSPKATALMKQEQIFEAAMSDLEGCVKDRKGEGFFAADIKMPTGAARQKQAQDAWLKGKNAINEYITIANTGLMRELNKIDLLE